MKAASWTPWAHLPDPPAPVAEGAVVVEARGVVVRRGSREVLHGVDLVARAGEVVALVGPNGAGKTTLLGALTGDLALSAGSVWCDGRELGEWTPPELALRRAVLPQQSTVSFPFTVEQVVRMGRAPWLGQPEEDQDDAVVAAALAEADIADLADRAVPSLSGGERARVALARVLAQAVPLLLLDEPTAALDLHHQELALRLVGERARAGAGAVVVLHDLGQAAAHADRIAILADGRVVAHGPPAEVLTGPLLSEVYRHPIEVIPHPGSGGLLVLPTR